MALTRRGFFAAAAAGLGAALVGKQAHAQAKKALPAPAPPVKARRVWIGHS